MEFVAGAFVVNVVGVEEALDGFKAVFGAEGRGEPGGGGCALGSGVGGEGGWRGAWEGCCGCEGG